MHDPVYGHIKDVEVRPVILCVPVWSVYVYGVQVSAAAAMRVYM
jgi:hypothetical protein